MPKHKIKKQTVVHVQIENPINLRKEILNTAINSAEIIKHYEVLKEVKNRKKQYQKRLVEVLDEIEDLRKKLEDHLPVVKYEEHKTKYPKPMKSSPKREPKPRVKPVKKQRDLHRSPMDKEIDDMRRKLESL